MKHNKIKYNLEKKDYSLLEVIVITLAFCSITGVIVGLTFYFRNNRNFILDDELLDIVDTYNKIKENYYGNVSDSVLATSAIEGMMNTLNEQYSTYLDENDTSDLSEKLDGQYKGIGISVSRIDKEIKVMNVYQDTPAYLAGIKKDDVILEINGYKIKEDDELDYVSSLIKSQKSVDLKIKRDDGEQNIKIDVKTIEYPALEEKVFERNGKKIGYIYLSTFSKTAANQIKKSLKNLESQNINSLIFDVRSNTGGYLDAAEDILNLFMKKGTLLYSIEDNNGTKKVYDTTSERRDYDVVVLVDQITASASEILASSFKENYGAILVGQKTYGKGLVQKTSLLSNKSMIKYTSAKWYTPEGNYINTIGYEPSIKVSLTKEYAANPCDETDNQLQKALEVLSK